MLDIRNYYEQLVIDELWQLKSNSEEELSQSFLEDVACLALNSLPTCYVCSPVDKSSRFTELDHEQIRVDVGNAIRKAMQKVRLRPHDR